jgi:hypothetical protein
LKSSTKKIQQTPHRQSSEEGNGKGAEIGILLITLAASLAVVGLYLERNHQPRVADGSFESQQSVTAENKVPNSDDQKLTALRTRALRDVNFYLKQAEQKNKQAVAKIRFENQMLNVDQAILDDLYYGHVPLDLRARPVDVQQEGFPGQVMEDIRGYEVARTEDELQQPLNDYLVEQQEVEHYNRAYRKAYVQVYLERMKAAGYDVRLSDNLEILEVKLIPPKQSLTAAVVQGQGIGYSLPVDIPSTTPSHLVDTFSAPIQGRK